MPIDKLILTISIPNPVDEVLALASRDWYNHAYE